MKRRRSLQTPFVPDFAFSRPGVWLGVIRMLGGVGLGSGATAFPSEGFERQSVSKLLRRVLAAFKADASL